MAKPVYLDTTDHINKAHYNVIAPAGYMPVSDYDKHFNYDPLYQPTSVDMPVWHTVTIANMIEMYDNGIIFKICRSEDTFEIHEKISNYIDALLQNQKRSTFQEAYLKKAKRFQEECAKVCRITHKRENRDKNLIKGSMMFVLNQVNKLVGRG